MRGRQFCAILTREPHWGVQLKLFNNRTFSALAAASPGASEGACCVHDPGVLQIVLPRSRSVSIPGGGTTWE